MATSTHNFSKATDFGGNYDQEQLKFEIDSNESITQTLRTIRSIGDAVSMIFAPPLTGAEITELNDVVGAHVPAVSTADEMISRIYYIRRSNSVRSTTASTWQEVVSLVTDHIQAGQYRIEWYYHVQTSSDEKAIYHRIRLDDTTDIFSIQEEAPDDDTTMIRNGWDIQTIAEGVHRVDLDYHAEDGESIEISQIRIAFSKL